MQRRNLLKSVAGLAVMSGTAPIPVFRSGYAAGQPMPRRVRPYDPEWPTASEWDALRKAVGGRLERVVSPLEARARRIDGSLCEDALADLANPFFIQDQAGATQTAGWIDGWTSAPSVYAVAAAGAADVAAAVNFAREKNLRLVVKGGAHSYLGQSNSANSLMIWTKHMDALELHDAFVPQACDGTVPPQPAVSVGSGAKFIQLYDFVTTQHGRYVQGGGCTSVGIGGHVQTGGFGSFSKYGGLVAASLLEAEIVTADGEIRIVNACSHPDLFLALKGGGAGFGVTTRLTLATRALPDRFGFLGQTIKAASDVGFRRLIGAFCSFTRETLINPHWGEQVTFTPDNALEIAMVFQGLSDDEARAAWAPFADWLAANTTDIAEVSDLRLVSMPARNWWDFAYRKENRPDSIIVDERPDAAPGRFWWSGNSSEVGVFLTGYESAWLPDSLLDPEHRDRLADALFAASRMSATTLHFNKGLAGATEERRAEARETSIQPAAIDAFALAIIANGQPQAYPGVLGHEPDWTAARADAERIAAAMSELRKVAPETGSYSSEMSFFEENWREAAWGPHYDRLLATKQKYDPHGLFTGHHQVGSEFWSADGFTRLG
jgi:FAD/FMN-containing dehydrogenase